MKMCAFAAETPQGWLAVIQPEGGEARAFEGGSRNKAERWARRMAYRQRREVTEQMPPWALPGHVLDYGEPVAVQSVRRVYVWDADGESLEENR